MNRPIDGKYKILATNPCKQGSIHTELDGCFFCVHDKYLSHLLLMYVRLLEDGGADKGQIMGAKAMLQRVKDWQYDNESKVKMPDVSNDCELNRVMNP